eukprot:CAMPEP_0194043408 /NCGR_PEP_ID=MMETSP0009_2-20130614/15044_1 /TAXON_ID=210454 /ORGANISM="Grammatophora oceanica, Strain CCMP 410" /LENGTH=723 /DNA_ID=CAMNT_0038687601 /DNA_START=102 /DNA_END=2273 /DNA_ORIENTATION=-
MAPKNEKNAKETTSTTVQTAKGTMAPKIENTAKETTPPTVQTAKGTMAPKKEKKEKKAKKNPDGSLLSEYILELLPDGLLDLLLSSSLDGLPDELLTVADLFGDQGLTTTMLEVAAVAAADLYEVPTYHQVPSHYQDEEQQVEEVEELEQGRSPFLPPSSEESVMNPTAFCPVHLIDPVYLVDLLLLYDQGYETFFERKEVSARVGSVVMPFPNRPTPDETTPPDEDLVPGDEPQVEPQAAVVKGSNKKKDEIQRLQFALGPGLCTISFTKRTPVEMAQTMMPYILENNMGHRGNELGFFRFNTRLYEYCQDDPDYCGIFLGAPRDQHQLIRPILDDVFGSDGSLLPSEGDFEYIVEDQFKSSLDDVDGTASFQSDPLGGGLFGEGLSGLGTGFTGNTWSKTSLRESAAEFLAGREEVKIGRDERIWSLDVLHKHTLGLDLGTAAIRNFMELQGISLILSILPDIGNLVDIAAENFGITVEEVNEVKELFRLTYKGVIMGTNPGIAESEADMMANGVLDTFLFAGGLSVPQTIKQSLGAYYSGWAGKDFNPKSIIDLNILIMETVRVFPPVLGQTFVDNVFGLRYSGTPGLVGFDKEVYGKDADEFRIRGDLEYYHSRSLNWAEAGGTPVEGAPWSRRDCPAKEMSIAMMSAFMEALVLEEWCVDRDEELVLQKGPTYFDSFVLVRPNDGATNCLAGTQLPQNLGVKRQRRRVKGGKIRGARH